MLGSWENPGCMCFNTLSTKECQSGLIPHMGVWVLYNFLQYLTRNGKAAANTLDKHGEIHDSVERLDYELNSSQEIF